MRVLLISGSTRDGSSNTFVLRALHEREREPVTTDLYEGLRSVPAFVPEEPAPAEVVDVLARIEAADAVVFSTPEYAGSLPGALKNLLDWTVGGGQLYGKPVAWLDVANPGRGHGARAQLRTVLDYVGAHRRGRVRPRHPRPRRWGDEPSSRRGAGRLQVDRGAGGGRRDRLEARAPGRSRPDGRRVDHQGMTTERSPALVRSRNRVLGGVCAGVAERVGVDPLLVRLLTVLLALISAGAVVVGYVVLWALLPEAAPQRPALAAGPTPPAAETAETAGTAEAPTVEMAAQVPAVEAPTVAGISETPLADPRGAWTAVGGELRAFAGELRRAHPTGDTTATDPTAAQPTATAEGADSRPAPLKAADRAMSAVGEQLRAPEVRSSARQVAARLSDAVRISADDLRRRTRGSG